MVISQGFSGNELIPKKTKKIVNFRFNIKKIIFNYKNI